MDIRINAVNFDILDNLTEHINGKVEKLFSQKADIIHADVALSLGSANDIENKNCQITLFVKGDDHLVKKNSKSFEQSVNECVDALQEILRREKAKQVNQRNDGNPVEVF